MIIHEVKTKRYSYHVRRNFYGCYELIKYDLKSRVREEILIETNAKRAVRHLKKLVKMESQK